MTPPVMQSPPGPEVVVDGRRYLYFGGTSYLGLHAHPAVIEAGCEALRAYGVHTATTRSGFGTSPLVVKVEELAARYFGTQEAFYFASGYAANHVVLPLVAQSATAIFLDEDAHFCVQEAARLTHKPIHRFRHQDPAHLAERLQAILKGGDVPLVVADGVSSAAGRVAPVNDLIRVLSRYAPSALHLDDAHGFGVLGARGRGTFELAGRWESVNGGEPAEGVSLSVGGTLAKALGGFGGVVPGTHRFLTELRRASHYYDGASAPASALAGSTAAALELLLVDPSFRERLSANIGRVGRGLLDLGIRVPDPPAAQAGFVLGGAENMRGLHQALRSEGILLPYLPAYQGVGSEGILRLAVFSQHTPEMLDRLFARLRDLARVSPRP